MSHPSWVCGLKIVLLCYRHRKQVVAPLVGVWIENLGRFHDGIYCGVAPLAGAWIEKEADASLELCVQCRTPRRAWTV